MTMCESIEADAEKILIVDDKTANLDLLREMLAPLGYQIYFATSGAKALDIAAGVQPDLVLLDVMMPDLDGFETCRRFKGDAALREIPVIFVTARTDVEDLARGFEVGAVDYVTKPVKQPEVRARVATHLRLLRLIREQRSHLEQIERARRELQELNDAKDKFMSNLGREATASVARIGDCGDPDGTAPRSPDDVLRLLGAIMEWPRLQGGQKLDLLSTQISDQELAALLASLDDLRFLSLAETKVGDAGIAHLQSLRNLQELHLDHTEVTDEGLEGVAELPNLEILDLKGTRITDEGLAHVGRMSGLTGLYLTRTGITDAGLRHLEGLKKLETLILWDTGIGDAGLEHLKPLKTLQEVILWNTRVTREGVAALQASLPDCDVSTTMFE
jgi:CheY-like chemotaxis protein